MHNQTSQAKSAQLKFLIILIISIFVILCLFFWILSDNSNGIEKVVQKNKLINPLDHAEPETIILEKVQHTVAETQKNTELLKKKVDEQILTAHGNDDAKQKLLEDRIAVLERKLNESQSNDSSNGQIAVSNNENYPSKLFPRQPAYNNDGIIQENADMHEDKLPIYNPNISNQPTRTIDNYVPSGTHVKAVVLGGADASAAVNAQSDPSVMLIRIIAEGTLPNHKKSHLKDCVVTAAATGDVSSSRGRIRTERMSCVFPNGEVFDESVEGTVFDSDGKNDVRGNRYDGTGEFTSRAFVAGTLSGLSEGLSQTYTTNSISAEGNVQTVNSGKIFQYGGAKGVGKAMDKLADYNIKRAEQLHPIIQLTAGNVVNVVFLKGFYLDEKKHDKDQENRLPDTNLFDMKTVSNDSASFIPPDEKMLPLSAEQVKRLQEKSKELGLRVTPPVS